MVLNVVDEWRFGDVIRLTVTTGKRVRHSSQEKGTATPMTGKPRGGSGAPASEGEWWTRAFTAVSQRSRLGLG